MENQKSIITDFCKNARYYLVKFDNKGEEEFGKILTNNELTGVSLNDHEIHRSIEYENDDKLFVLNLKPESEKREVDNIIKLLLNTIDEARIIEMVYPSLFRWVYDGLAVKAYAIIPSGDPKSHSTITRYGGTDMFIRILKQHLNNVGRMNKGITPDYNFLHNDSPIAETEISLGSINRFTKMFSVGINSSMDYMDIIKNSKNNVHVWQPLNRLNMKYWAREINPDFISEAKHIKLNQQLTLDEGMEMYPQPIKTLMALRKKGNYNRFLLARFLLAVHTPHDAKFVYFSVLDDEEKAHIKSGNCSTQWNYVVNNMKRYDCPSMSELKRFTDSECKLSHPLEDIQKYLEERGKKDDK